jgi:hypothetical protein
MPKLGEGHEAYARGYDDGHRDGARAAAEAIAAELTLSADEATAKGWHAQASLLNGWAVRARGHAQSPKDGTKERSDADS